MQWKHGLQLNTAGKDDAPLDRARNWMEMSSNSKGSANLPFGAVRKAVAHHTGAPPIQPLISVPIIVLNVSGKLFFFGVLE